MRFALSLRNYSDSEGSAPIASDVAILILAYPLSKKKFRAARLPGVTWKAPRAGDSVRASGYGGSRTGTPPRRKPRVASLIVASSSLCSFVSRYAFQSTSHGVMCAVAPHFPSKSGGGVCEGDSGGPLLTSGPTVRGIIIKRAWVGTLGGSMTACGHEGAVAVAVELGGVVRAVKRAMRGNFDEWRVRKLR